MAEDVVYKSPVSKLVRFIRKSGDEWKEQCQERKRLCRKLSNQWVGEKIGATAQAKRRNTLGKGKVGTIPAQEANLATG